MPVLVVEDDRQGNERRGPFVTTLVRYPGKGGWTFAVIPKSLAPPVTRPWGPAGLCGAQRSALEHERVGDQKTGGALLPVPKRIRGGVRPQDEVTVEFTFDAGDL